MHGGGSSARPTSRSPAGGPPVSGDRSVPAGHRRADFAEAGPGCHSRVLHPRPRARPAADRDDHGSSAPCPRVPDQLLPGACHVTDRYANKPVDADHGRLKARLRTVRGPERLRSARTISSGHAFAQNIRGGHYEHGVDVDPNHRLPAAFTGRALAIRAIRRTPLRAAYLTATQQRRQANGLPFRPHRPVRRKIEMGELMPPSGTRTA